MAETPSAPTGAPAHRRRWRWVASGVRLGGAAAALAAFLYLFDSIHDQRLVDCLWLLAIVLWIAEVKARGRGPLLGLPLTAADAVPIAAILIVFAAAWLPFYDNWRWAYTGDSFGVFGAAHTLAQRGLRQNILSVHGIEDSFTYLWEVLYALPMLLFGPTLFWHRVGLLVMSCLSLVAIYAYFTIVLDRYWASAIVAATAVNYVWLWFSYISYLKIDSFIFYYLTLIGTVLIWRRPDQLGAWMFTGLIGGLAFFFTPTAWSAVVLVGLGLGVFALATRRFGPAVVYGVSFALAAVPIIIEIPWLLTTAARQSQPTFHLEYMIRTFRQVILLPYDFSYYKLGVQGQFLHGPLGPLYLVGLGIAAVAIVPPLRRWLRVPAVAPALLGLLLWDAVLLTVTNKDYGQPSTKRAYNLIPLQIFFALLPAIVAGAWVAPWRWLRRAVAGAVVAMLVVYASINVRLIMHPRNGVYGTNVFDALIELRQRFPERRVFLLTSRTGLLPAFAADGMFNFAYHLLDQLTIRTEFSDAVIAEACGAHAIICYEPNFDAAYMQPVLQRHHEVQSFPILNSIEAFCFSCTPALNVTAPGR